MNTHDTEHQADADTHFSTAVAGLPTAVETDVVDLAEGTTINTAAPAPAAANRPQPGATHAPQAADTKDEVYS